MDPRHPPTGDALTAPGVTGAIAAIALAAATSEAPTSHTLRRVRMRSTLRDRSRRSRRLWARLRELAGAATDGATEYVALRPVLTDAFDQKTDQSRPLPGATASWAGFR